MARAPAKKSRARPQASAGRPARAAASAKAPKRPVLEWAAALLGGTLTALALAVIAFQALLSDQSPPALAVRATGVVSTPQGFLVRVRVSNLGGAPAAGVTVEGVVAGEGEPETSDVTFDYIAAKSSREGGLAFTRDPRQGGLSVRAKGYVDP